MQGTGDGREQGFVCAARSHACRGVGRAITTRHWLLSLGLRCCTRTTLTGRPLLSLQKRSDTCSGTGGGVCDTGAKSHPSLSGNPQERCILLVPPLPLLCVAVCLQDQEPGGGGPSNPKLKVGGALPPYRRTSPPPKPCPSRRLGYLAGPWGGPWSSQAPLRCQRHSGHSASFPRRAITGHRQM